MIIDRVVEIVAVKFNVEEGDLDEKTSFVDDLNADSIELFDLVMTLEDEFDFEVDEEDIESIETIGDAVEYIEDRIEG